MNFSVNDETSKLISVIIGIATKIDTKNELINQKLGFLLIICKGLNLECKNVKYLFIFK